MLTEGYGII